MDEAEAELGAGVVRGPLLYSQEGNEESFGSPYLGPEHRHIS